MCSEILNCSFFKALWSAKRTSESLTDFVREPGSKHLGQVHSIHPTAWNGPKLWFHEQHPTDLKYAFLHDRGMDLIVSVFFFFFISHYYCPTSHAIPVIRRKHPSWRTSTGKKKWSRWRKQAEVATGGGCTRIDTWKEKNKVLAIVTIWATRRNIPSHCYCLY